MKHRRPSVWMAAALGILGLAPLAAQEIPEAQDPEPAAAIDAGTPALAVTPAEPAAVPPESAAPATESPPVASAPSASPDAPGAPVEAPVPAAAGETSAPPATTHPATLPAPAPAAPDPRAGDRPGWWFQAALRAQPRGYPAFLGARFADATRAVVIEVPARTLEAGRPLVYQVWACNDLPGALDGRVSCRVERDGAPVAADPPAALRVKGGTVEAAPRARHATRGWAPGDYVIRAALCDSAGAVLHRAAETVTVTSATEAE